MIASRAFTLLLAIFGTSRINSYYPITHRVSGCRNKVILVCITASAGISCVTLLFASRCCYYCFVAMFCCRNYFCLGVIASRAFSLLFTIFGTSRINSYYPITHRVTKRCLIIINLHVSASASVSCITSICTCGGSYHCNINVRLCFGSITSGAMTNMSFFAILITLDFGPNAKIMTKRINDRIYV